MPEAVNIVIDKIIKANTGCGEGCSLIAYWDADGGVWTIGYGCTGPHITKGTVWTSAECESNLIARVTDAYHQALTASPILVMQSAERQAAITDMIYNMGLYGYVGHSLKPLIDAGNWTAAAVEIKKFNHAGGRIEGGLTKRRAIDSELLLVA